MKFLDVHAHLDDKRIMGNIDEVASICLKKEVFVISSGVNPKTNRIVLDLSKKYKNFFASAGFYPFDSIAEKIKNKIDFDLREIEPFSLEEEMEFVKKNKDYFIAIGEIGMDFSDFTEYKKEQEKVFESLILLAKNLDKPVIIHSRKAEEECIEILEKFNMKKVIMHCFNGKKSLIKRCIQNKWFLTVPPVLLRLEHFKMLAEIVPLDNLLTETDSPYLAPNKGEINYPWNVEISVKEISKIKKISEENVQSKIIENAKKLFNFN
ncbi:MAG: TatD family hydrolase [Candidatus Pacearchaeota archaeon]